MRLRSLVAPRDRATLWQRWATLPPRDGASRNSAAVRCSVAGCVTRARVVQQELSDHNCKKSRLEVWQRGVDTDMFNPRFRCNDMRARMTDGHPDAPLLIHVGRLGAEKNLFVLKDIMAQLPGARLAFVGDGPSRKQLQEHFADMPTVKFMVRCTPRRLSRRPPDFISYCRSKHLR